VYTWMDSLNRLPIDHIKLDHFLYLFVLRTFVLSHHGGTEDTERNQ